VREEQRVVCKDGPHRSECSDVIRDAEIAKRPPVQLMYFGDYDHDGAATEFYLQTDAVPCGKSYGVVIGVWKSAGISGTRREYACSDEAKRRKLIKESPLASSQPCQ
jgi:hypothetical protein